ncbi:phage holin family protein [Candidatus Curtissbacteria bacterium]|nr:phage holin family protein [Candidatus Curtissbacteria bacterium]
MINTLANLILSAIALLVVAYVVPGFHVASFTTAIVVALILGVINAFAKPILLILTLPITIITLGFFTFILNAVILLLISRFVPGFTIDGFVPALIGAVVLWLIGLLIHFVVFPVKAL